MSLLLMMFYWLVIPGVGVVAAIWLWRSAKPRSTKILALIPIVPIFAWLAWTLYGGEKFLLDRQVQELCAKDGGVKIYETVKLPANKFGERGILHIPDKAQAKLTDEYYYESEIRYFQTGNPEMSRRQYRIVRRNDGKVLGELVFYGRGGGDLPGPWHGSSFTCPEPTKLPNFESSIFIKGE